MGMFMITGLQSYAVYYVEPKRTSSTYEKMERIKTSISSFVNIQKRYPCPSDPALGVNDPNFGLENCTLAAAVNVAPDCTGAGDVCKIAGARVTPASASGQPDFVLIGGVPFKTILCAGYDCTTATASDNGINTITADDIQDGWGSQMTYAVSGYMVMSASFDASYGSIGIQKEDGGSLISPANGAHYAIVSHGSRGMGAYTVDGKIKTPCTAGSPLEQENCDRDDAIFLNGLKSAADEATYFTDIIAFQTYTLSSIWDYSTVSGNENDVYNLNAGNVGIGIATPTEKLEVNGAIKGDIFKADQICDMTGMDCFDPSVLGGAVGSTCPPAAAGFIKLVTGVGNNAVECSGDIPFPSGLAGKSCPPGPPQQYMVGMNSLGEVICKPL